MAFERTIKIFNFDLDEQSCFKPSAAMHYIQQLALSDCDNVGMTYSAMRDAGQVFVLTKSRLAFFKPVMLYDELICTTWATRVRGATFEREFEILRGNDKIAACTTQWVLLDYVKRKILRPSELIGQLEHFPERHCGIEMPGKFRFDGECEECDARRVYYSMIDENRHLNNCFYSDIALDYCENKRLSSIQINYLEEAFEGNILSISKAALGDGSLFLRGYNRTLDRSCFEALVQFCPE